MAMRPDQQDVFFQLIISGGGEFRYDANGNLREAAVSSTTTDPQQGLTCPSGRSFWNGHGAIIILISDANDAIFIYFDNGSAVQGGLAFSAASANGTDPVTSTAYIAGQTNTNTAFGDQTKVLGSAITLLAVLLSQGAGISIQTGAGATSPGIMVEAPEQTQSGHLTLLLQGTSPDGTHLGQMLVAREPTGHTVPAAVTSGLVEMQSPATGLADSLLQLLTATGGVAGDNMLGARVRGDTQNRFRVNADGALKWGPGSATQDCTLSRQAANIMQLLTADLDIATAGRGLKVAEGANARMGTATLNGTTAVVVANTTVTATTRIFLTVQGTTAPVGIAYVSARVAGTSFSLKSTSASDTAVVVAWLLVEPG